MTEYIFFTDEQKQTANSVDLEDFLNRQGELLVRSGRDKRLKSDHSITVRGNRWFDHSTEKGGLAIDFVKEFYNLSFQEAVLLLLGKEKGIEFRQADKAEKKERKPFSLPEANSDMRRVFAYLIKQRFIDRRVLEHFVRAKMLYEDKSFHNVVFVGFDENGAARHAHKRGTCSNSGYRGNVEGSDPRYSFHYTGNGPGLYVFEAPIDMLSFITLNQNNWQQRSYVALEGVGEQAMFHQLKLNSHIKNVMLCLDHDGAGIEAAYRLTEILNQNGYTEVKCIQPEYKDWNECLKAKNGVTPVPAKEHPALEMLPELCSQIYEVCESMKSKHGMKELLLKNYDSLKPVAASGRIGHGKEETAAGYLKCISACCLLGAQKEYSHLGKQMTTEKLTEELIKSCNPLKDKKGLRSRFEDIKQDIAAVNQLNNAPGIRSCEDKQKMIGSYMKLAVDCLKMNISINIEVQKHSTELIREQSMDKTVQQL